MIAQETTDLLGALNSAPACTVPAAKSVFLEGEAAVYFWAAYTGAQSGDVFSVIWVDPSGALEPAPSSTTINANETTGCINWSLAIAGAPPGADPGAWQAKMYHNGTLVTTQTFSVGASNTFVVTGQTMTATFYGDPSDVSWSFNCEPVTPQSTFQPSADRYLGVWFSYEGARSGDVFSFDWTYPNGTQWQTFDVTTEPSGTGCFAYWVSASAFEGGGWHVTVSRNGIKLFSLPFSVD
jgi:hypothetical protein